MLTEVINDDQLEKLLWTSGFLVNVDYPTKDVKFCELSLRQNTTLPKVLAWGK